MMAEINIKSFDNLPTPIDGVMRGGVFIVSNATVASKKDDKFVLRNNGKTLDCVVSEEITNGEAGDFQKTNYHILRPELKVKEIKGVLQPPDEEHPNVYLKVNRIYYYKL